MKTYKYDIAISLCKQDVEFARQLCNALNPGLKVFFYENKQDELISKNGAEKFAKIFKEESRVVVILSRNEWSESFYTEIERNAIIDRTSVKNEGYGFLLVIPLEPGQEPSWYPSTRIYANPRRFNIEDLVRFIEFKLTEQGGEVKPITLEERMDYFQQKLDGKKEWIRYLLGSESVQEAEAETRKLMELFNKRVDTIVAKGLQFSTYQQKLQGTHLYIGHPIVGRIGLDDHHLQVVVNIDSPFRANVRTSQSYIVEITLLRQLNEYNKAEVVEQKNFRFNKTNEYNIGWSLVIQQLITDKSDRTIEYLFHTPFNTYYDLKDLTPTEVLIEHWFTGLFKLVEEKFKPVLL